MSTMARLGTWAWKRRKLLAGVVGFAVETAVAAVPGVNVAAKVLGEVIEHATAATLPEDQHAQVGAWLETVMDSYGGLVDRLEKLNLPDAEGMEKLTQVVKQAIEGNDDLAKRFDEHLALVRRQTLSLNAIEAKLDEQFHVQQRMNASLEEIKGLFIRSPMASDWAELRKARPEAVGAVVRADEHFLAGRKSEGVAELMALLKQRGVGTQTLALHLGLVQLGGGDAKAAAAVLDQAADLAVPLVRHSKLTMSTLSGKGASSAWRSLPRGFEINGKYRIADEIGRGGMSSVYRAVLVEEFEKGAEVAIKVPAPHLLADSGMKQRFLKEIERSRQLEHANIVRVRDYERFTDPHKGTWSYGLVMELVPGQSLSSQLAWRRMENKPLTLDEVRSVVNAVGKALAFAHGKGLLHRDVKPHNVLLSSKAIKLTDFGIARELGDSESSMTQAGQVIGTLPYMPPEMLCPDEGNPVGVRADVYMLGVLLQELLTFAPNGNLKARADVPTHWRDLIRAARQHDQEERPESVEAFLTRFRGAVVPPPPPPPPPPVWPAEITNSLGMKFVRVPAGVFLMGSPETEKDRDADEGPQHEVEISQMYTGIYPVTMGQFRAFVKATGYKTEAERGDGARGWTGSEFKQDKQYNWLNPGFSQGDDHPVVCVNWNDANEFIAWMGSLAAEKAKGHRYRLPTEAEWEYNCRSSGATARSPFHYGESLSSNHANFDGNYPYGGAAKGEYRKKTTPVGSFKPNAFGLFDCHGNVWEWCSDWFAEDYYKSSPRKDPPGPTTGTLRVLRGGSWYNLGHLCRSACRVRNTPDVRVAHFGFRVVLVPQVS